MFENRHEITDKPIQKMINGQLGVKLNLCTILKKWKVENQQASMKYPPKFGRQENLTTYFYDYVTQSINKTREMDERLHPLLFPKKGNLRITKNYRGITLTAIAAKVYNTLLLNHIQPKIQKVLRKNQNNFQRNHLTTLQILTIHWIVKGVQWKNL